VFVVGAMHGDSAWCACRLFVRRYQENRVCLIPTTPGERLGTPGRPVLVRGTTRRRLFPIVNWQRELGLEPQVILMLPLAKLVVTLSASVVLVPARRRPQPRRVILQGRRETGRRRHHAFGDCQTTTLGAMLGGVRRGEFASVAWVRGRPRPY